MDYSRIRMFGIIEYLKNLACPQSSGRVWGSEVGKANAC